MADISCSGMGSKSPTVGDPLGGDSLSSMPPVVVVVVLATSRSGVPAQRLDTAAAGFLSLFSMDGVPLIVLSIVIADGGPFDVLSVAAWDDVVGGVAPS